MKKMRLYLHILNTGPQVNTSISQVLKVPQHGITWLELLEEGLFAWHKQVLSSGYKATHIELRRK
jgi:hypothetical protein